MTEENIAKINLVHQRETAINNTIVDICSMVAWFGVGMLVEHIIHVKLWNKANIKTN